MLDQVSGLYLHGDSQEALTDNQFQATFSYIITYTFMKNHDENNYFPIFMMGKSLQSFLKNRVPND